MGRAASLSERRVLVCPFFFQLYFQFVQMSLSLCLSQVDPGFAYAYTLLGHEFVLTEELDRALACFRNAIRVNNRHYNAWYATVSIYTRPYHKRSTSLP